MYTRPTIIEEYITAAIRRAVVMTSQDDDSVVCAYVPELPGVRAFGRDVHEAAAELYKLIDMGIPVWLANGHELPVLDGIDLNTDRGKTLSTYHRGTPAEPRSGEVYPDEDALNEAFLQHLHPA